LALSLSAEFRLNSVLSSAALVISLFEFFGVPVCPVAPFLIPAEFVGLQNAGQALPADSTDRRTPDRSRI